MRILNRLTGLVFFVLCVNMTFVQADIFPVFDVEQTKEEITLELSKDLKGSPHEEPIIVLVGGYPGAGKTTLINSLAEKQDIAVISWNAVRQALLDRRLKGSPYDFEIVIAVYRNLLRMCMQRHLNVAIDMNAHGSNIKEVESFVKREQDGQGYQVVKICLNPSVETLFARVRARPQVEGLHQGTEKDVQNDISATIKKIDLNDYGLVINSEIVPFETEFKIVNAFLEPYLLK